MAGPPEEMVRCLPADLACTIVTHSPGGIAVALVERLLIEVILYRRAAV